MQKWFYLHDLMYMLAHNHVERHFKKDFKVLSLHNVMCPLHGHTLIVPDGRTTLSFSFSLADSRCLFDDGVGMSSTEVAGEATRRLSTPETMGVASAEGRTDGPFPVMRTPFLPMFAKGSSFLDLIFTYISLLNLVVISKKKINKKRERERETKKSKVHT